MQFIISRINRGGSKRWTRVFIAMRIFDILFWTYDLLIFGLKMLNMLENPFYVYIIFLLAPVYYFMNRLINKKGLQSKGDSEKLLSESGVEPTKLSYNKLNRSSRLRFILLDYHLRTILLFSTSVGDISPDSYEFSEDDLGLFRFWISNDKDLKNCLENYNIIREEDFATLMSILSARSDTSSTQWCQLCEVLFEFMGGEPESEEIRREMCV